MNLTRPKPAKPLISLVSMIDLLLIMLVFFMVTSTYLNLDMIPMAQSGDAEANNASTAPSETAPAGATLLLSLGANGRVTLSGRSFGADELQGELQARVARTPEMRVLILPSGHAKTQALISVMDAVTNAGITELKVVELEPRP